MEEVKSDFEILNVRETSNWKQRLDLDYKSIFKHTLLFVITFFSISFTSIQFFFDWNQAFLFASLLLLFLGIHEFGHYLTAVYYKIKVTLPYFIPLPILSPVGTMGAVIRIKERIRKTKALFDIGIAGPLAGFIVSLVLLFIGFYTLPTPIEFVNSLPNETGHTALGQYVTTYGTYPDAPTVSGDEMGVLVMGDTLLFSFLSLFFNNIPPMWELYHFPFLFAGWLGLLFTALNLTPVGQLDGGHILYGLVGFEKHKLIARLFVGLLSLLGGVGFVPLITSGLYDSYTFLAAPLSWAIWGIILFILLQKAFDNEIYWITITASVSMLLSFILLNTMGFDAFNGYTSWAVWILFIVYLVKVEHPPVMIEEELDPSRKWLGWLSMLIFVVCISPNPFYFIEI